jgi:two-component system, chemotaxis family, chemotaxis protein CheY
MNISDLSVLLVEPTRTQAQVITGFLEQMGTTLVQVATTGQEALAMVLSEGSDLVISSMHLPDMTGAELLDAIRQDEAAMATPFVLISSETQYRYLEPVRQAGVTGIISKPFHPAKLEQILRIAVETTDPLPNVGELKVLVVDDSLASRRFISMSLDRMGFEEITQAVDAFDAIEKLKTNYFDLIITDYNMPEMHGLELIKFIREESNQSSVPILMVTSDANKSVLAGVQREGVVSVCHKPFVATAMQGLIGSLLAESD